MLQRVPQISFLTIVLFACLSMFGCGEDQVVAPKPIDLSGSYEGTFAGGSFSGLTLDTIWQQTFMFEIGLTISDTAFGWGQLTTDIERGYPVQRGSGTIEVVGDSIRVHDTEFRDALNIYYVIGGTYKFLYDGDNLVLISEYDSGYSNQVVLRKLNL